MSLRGSGAWQSPARSSGPGGGVSPQGPCLATPPGPWYGAVRDPAGLAGGGTTAEGPRGFARGFWPASVPLRAGVCRCLPPPLGWVSLWPREGGWQGVRGWQRGWVSRNLLFPLPVAMVCVGAVLQNWICASVYLACLSWAWCCLLCPG